MALLADVLMHGGLFGLFLISFFYIFVVFIQQIALHRDIRNIMDNYLQDIYLGSNDLQRKMQIAAVDVFIRNASSNAKGQQDELNAKNSRIIKNTFFMGLLPSCIAVVLAIFITYFSGENVTEFVLQNLITLGFIIISEVVIVGLFLNSFAIIDAGFVKATYVTQSHETNMKQCEYISNWLNSTGLNKFAPNY